MSHSGYSDDVCIVCGNVLSRGHKTPYCQKHLIQKRQKDKIQEWLNSGNTGMTVDTTIRGAIRNYVLKDQDYRCLICGMKNEWNGESLNFILDHINGDASDSSRNNIRLICPNCDSQLSTYKSKNKNSARNKRKKFLRLNNQ